MPEPSFSSTLYDTATECALRRQNRSCRNRFGSEACETCRLNIANYINADPRQVDLFMLQAETRANAVKSVGTTHRFVFALIIGISLFFAWKGYTAEQARIERGRLRSIASTAQAQPTRPAPANIHVDIDRTLRRVEADLRKKVDVNRDGLINCIDAAVLFYQYFPDKSKVTISVNRNGSFHHLFNVVNVNGTWRAVEPQAYWRNHSSYWMRDVWGKEYDSSFNRVVTDDYRRFVK